MLDNPLTNEPADPQASPQATPPPHPVIGMAGDELNQASAQFKKIAQAKKSATMVRGQLDEMTKLGDAITGDDVIEGLGKMVAGGMDPASIVAMIAGNPQAGQAPMPDSGQALAAWVQQHEAQFGQMEQQIAQAHSLAAQKVGMAGMHNLLLHHMEAAKKEAGTNAGQAQGAGSAPASPSPLTA